MAVSTSGTSGTSGNSGTVAGSNARQKQIDEDQAQKYQTPQKHTEQDRKRRDQPAEQSSISQEEDEDDDTEEFTEECSSPEITRGDLTPKPNKKIEGVIPKDIESKKEMMSFIAYPQHLEYACKLISNSKAICLTEGTHDKNRIYLSGTSIMSTKLTVSLA